MIVKEYNIDKYANLNQPNLTYKLYPSLIAKT